MHLILCEKPSQAKDIAAALGITQRGNGMLFNATHKITWAFGHILSTAHPDTYNPALKYWNLAALPILPQKWLLETQPSSAAQYKIIAKLVKELTATDTLIIATDADREGEVIAREILDKVGCKAQIKRLWLSALDADSIKKAYAKLRADHETKPLYASGLGRQRADWLTGMNMTMALSVTYGKGGKDGTLHCGRVQSPTLNLIVQRERIIRNFEPSQHYLLKTSFNVNGTNVPMHWQVPDSFKVVAGHVSSKGVMDDVAYSISGHEGQVTAVEKSRQRKAPAKLFYLGSLQQEAAKMHGIKVQTTLDICQALYEKHKATSYPRTDAEYLPVSMFADATLILNQLDQYQPNLAPFLQQAQQRQARSDKPQACFNDKKVTGHHAIIPTNNDNVDTSLFSKDERTIYDLICKRYIAQFLADYEFDQTIIKVECNGFEFKATGKIEQIKGWQQLYQADKAGELGKENTAETDINSEVNNESDNPDNLTLPEALQGNIAKNTRCEIQSTMTKPPLRYAEDTLLKAMESIDSEIDDVRLRKIMQTKEKAGIGTDATRATVIENLFAREYISNDKKYLVPTAKGEHLIQVFEQVAPDLIDPVLTATWEDKLNQIEQGSYTLPAFEREIGIWLQTLIESIRQDVPVAEPRQSNATDRPSYSCPTCAKPMTRHESKFKKGEHYWSCSAFKETGCKTTMDDKAGKPIAKSAAPVKSRHLCGVCSKSLIFRQGTSKAGKPYKLWGCAGYPKCNQSYHDDNGQPQFTAI